MDRGEAKEKFIGKQATEARGGEIDEPNEKCSTENRAELTSLGQSRLDRFQKFREAEDIDNAIDYLSQGLLLTPDDHMEKPTALNDLGIAYQYRFQYSGQLVDINKAIECKSQAVLLTSDGHAKKAGLLSNLGNSYRSRFEYFGEFTDIEKAIDYQVQAMQLTPDNNTNKPAILNNVGNSYLERFERRGDLADVDLAIQYQRQSVMLSPNNDPDKPGRISNLGNSYLGRFERLSDRVDIDAAIECHSRSVSLTPDNDADKPDWLNNLGASFHRRFERYGELADIDKAIECLTQAVLQTPDIDPDMPGRLNILGASYQRRFERLGKLADINQSIYCKSQAVLVTPDVRSEKPRWLSSLGNAYQRRFEQLQELSDIDKAIDCGSQAMLLVPEGDADRPGMLSNLGVSYSCRFERLSELSDIEKSIDCLSQAVLLSPENHAEKPDWLNNLGSSYYTRFEHYGDVSDINQSIESQGEAVLLTPDGHPTSLRADAELAIAYFQQAAESVVNNPRVQFKAARAWAKFSHLGNASPQSAYQKAMELVPQLIWLGITIDERYDLMVDIGDLAMDAGAWAISVQAYDLALEWLEQGRSVVWRQILHLRTPFEDLSSADSELAQCLRDVSCELERSGSRPRSSEMAAGVRNLEHDVQRQHRLATEWNQLLERARLVPGFADFMRPPKANNLMRAAKDGPIVVINTHSSRCDALVILPARNNIAHVPLERFSMEKALKARAQLISLIGHRGGRTRGLKLSRPVPRPEVQFQRMLAILWSDIVKPVLDFLGYTDKSLVDALPHLTWCTTGVLSFLPLHAAGCYDGSQPGAFDLIISSYTPMLGTLLAPTPIASNQHIELLVVGQEHTKGLGTLPGTVPELAIIKEHAKAIQHLQLDGNTATVDAVLDAMEEYSWVHLACHASQSAGDPTQSAFHLHDGNLALAAITKRAFKNKGLAFLSACQTATGDNKLPDEAIHLAAGMLMAGYPSVIATMWGIVDEDAPDVAREVYADLLKDGKMDCTGASRALHKAVAGLRERVGQESFERWVPFIHIGA